MRRSPSSSAPPVVAALPALAVATALLLTGCSAGGAASPTATEGPLDAYLSAVSARQDGADATELNARVETLTAACMAAEGFDYVAPQPQTEDGSVPSAEWSPDDPDWVARYGYGVVQSPSAEGGGATPAADRNSAYADSLPEGERDAYWATLYGDGDDADDAGCYGDAYDEVAGDDPAQQDAFQPLMDAIASFWDSLPEAPEMADLDAAWSECMAAAGHDLRRQPDAQQSIADAATTVFAAEPVDDAAVATLHDDEVALAEDDLRCREDTDYTARAQQVQTALQQRFVDDHRAELEALVAAAQASR